MDKILYSPKEGTTGFRGLRDVLEKPDEYIFRKTDDLDGYLALKIPYEKALESCKSNSLEIVNPEVLPITRYVNTQLNMHAFALDDPYKVIEPGDIFNLPEGYSFKEEYNCSDCPITDCSSALCPKRVLRLVSKPEPEESQNKLWMQLYNECEGSGITHFTHHASKYFTITRK